MIETFAIPAVIAVLVWWVSTGLVLWAARHCPAHQGRTAGRVWQASGLAALGFAIAWVSSRADAPWAAFAGFAAAIMIWGWIELAFLTGTVTGTHARPCPPDAAGIRRFLLAAGAVIHHELALFGSAIVLGVISLGGSHDTAFWTFAVLLVMRLSTKLNLYLGVANFTDGFLPPQLAYLKSYFRTRSLTWLMVLSLAGAAAMVWIWANLALGAPSGTASQFGAALVCVLAFLGLIEHGFLMLPVREAALWRWAGANQAPMSETAGPGGRRDVGQGWGKGTAPIAASQPCAVPKAHEND